MPYLIFLLALALAAIVYGFARLLRFSITFEMVFKALATAIVMLPIAIAGFAIWGCIVAAAIMVTGGILMALGLYDQVAAWSLWTWGPFWAWLLIPAIVLFCATSLPWLVKYIWVVARE